MDLELLKSQVKDLEKNTVTDWYLMSLWELVNLYKSTPKELIINPKYQRVFRWTKEQKSKLIESLILWLPLPWFFVAENEKWQWEVVDWLQRLSTILEFMDILEWKDLIKKSEKISNGLDWTLLVKWLSWVKWSDLPEEYQLRIKRTRVYVSILKNTWDLKAKYEVFQRLNTWWTKLSDQEVRNCIIIDRKEEYFDKILEFSKFPDYKNLVSILWDQSFLEKKDMEMVIRYIALKNIVLEKEFTIEEVIDSFVYNLVWIQEDTNIFNWIIIDLESEFNTFKNIFSFLKINIWEDVFFPRDGSWSVTMKRMKYPIFDTIAQWIAFNVEKRNIDLWNDTHKEILKQKILNLQGEWTYMWDEIYKKWNWSARRFKLCSIYGKEYFNLNTTNE